MNRYTPTKKPGKTKAPPPWEAWNREHPELVCADSACPHNHQSVERRQTKVWQMLHQLSHGRATFTAEALADYADVPLAEAEENVAYGCDMNLVMLVGKTAASTRPGATPAGRPVYARFAKPEGKKAPSAKTKQARAFGQAATTLWAAG